MPLVLAAVSLLTAGAPAAAADPPAVPADTLPNVRPCDTTAALFMRFGLEQSPRFRNIVRALERSKVIVYVQIREATEHPRSGGLNFLGETNGFRWVRARVDSGTGNHARTLADIVHLTAILGHELHHALEASEAPSMADVEEFERYFRAIGVRGGRSTLDTIAAREVGHAVAEELRGRRVRLKPPHGQTTSAAAN
jgi:hypothetical protein